MLVTTSDFPLDEQLRGKEMFESVAVVDDPLFSALTVSTGLETMPPNLLRRVHVFCLQGRDDTQANVSEFCPVTLGFAASGYIDSGLILEGVSFINASGLVIRPGI